MLTQFSISDRERFWSQVDMSGECWLWLGVCDKHGYGHQQRIGGMRTRPHRFAWTITFGSIPEGMSVCHACDNPQCVNPAHLFVGTHLDNMHDCTAKGRRPIGPRLRAARAEIIDLRRELATLRASHEGAIDSHVILPDSTKNT